MRTITVKGVGAGTFRPDCIRITIELKAADADYSLAMELANVQTEELQKAVEQVEDFKDKKNAEIASLRQQIIDLQKRTSEFDEMRKAHIVLKEENEGLQKNIEKLEQTAKQNAEVQNRRSIETGNLIDGLKQQLASASALAEDYKRRFNSLSADGNEKQANFAKITAERDDAKAELKRIQVTLSKKQHEAQAMNDAIIEKDRRIAALMQEMEQLKANAAQRPAAAAPYSNDDPYENDPAIKDAVAEIDDIDWVDDGNQPPHPGEDPRQLSLF
jgi:chromosome segregation ATPase